MHEHERDLPWHLTVFAAWLGSIVGSAFGALFKTRLCGRMAVEAG